MPSFIARPSSPGPQPAVIFYMDIFDPREELYALCRRIARNGYVAVLPQLFYRDGSFTCHPAEHTKAEMTKAMALNLSTTNRQVAQDTRAVIDYLQIQEGVESDRIGTIGTCMGARHALIAAATYPENIHAFVCIHGGRMMTDAPDSPHLFIPSLAAEGHIG